MVINFCIGFNPFKAVVVYTIAAKPVLVVVALNQADFSVKPAQYGINLVRLPRTDKVADNNYNVATLNFGIPLPYHIRVHSFGRFKAAHVQLSVELTLVKM